MSTVNDVALAALRETEKKAAETERLRTERLWRKESQAKRKRIQKYYYLLDESVLPSIFPETTWYVLDACDTDTDTPWLSVREADDATTPVFRVCASGTFIDYEDVTYMYGNYPMRRQVSQKILTPLDVGRYLKRRSEMIAESYRRFPD